MPNSRIKIFHLITSLETGGAQQGLLLGLPLFDPDKYEHVICSITDRMHMAPYFEKIGIKTISLGLSNKTDIFVAWRLRKILNQHSPDVLHTYLFHGNLLGRIIGSLAAIPVIVSSERTIGQANSFARILTRLTNPLAQAVEVNSTAVQQSVVQHLGTPKCKIRIIRSGFDINGLAKTNPSTNIKEELDLPNSSQIVLIAGRLRTVKGIDYGLKAFSKFLQVIPDTHLLIAGDGEERRNLEILCGSLNIQDNVHLLGVRSDLPAILNMSDALLLPSLTEGFPRIAVEAAAAGCPIVATNVGGTPEIVQDGQTGMLVEVKNTKQMAGALINIFQNSKLRSQIIDGGLQKSKEFTIESYVNSLQSMYLELLNKHSYQV